MKKKTFQFEYVNDKTWASLIEQSVGPVKSYTALPRKQSSRLFSVALVSLYFCQTRLSSLSFPYGLVEWASEQACTKRDTRVSRLSAQGYFRACTRSPIRLLPPFEYVVLIVIVCSIYTFRRRLQTPKSVIVVLQFSVMVCRQWDGKY